MTKKEWNACVNDLQKMKLTPKERRLREENAKRYSPSRTNQLHSKHSIDTTSPSYRNDESPEVNFDLVRHLLKNAMEKQEEQKKTDLAFEEECNQFMNNNHSTLVKKTKFVKCPIDEEFEFPKEEAKEIN